MSGKTVIRILVATGLAVLTLLVSVYFLNPLRTPSRDPVLRIAGSKMFRIPSRGMQPTLQPNDIFVVSAWPYWRADPKPGDIVVFQYPLDPAEVLVKRVIAGGGSTVEIVEGVPVVDGRPIEEPYVDPGNNTQAYARTMSRVVVPADSFFVMGDNRDNSNDSRSWGFVRRSQIIGKVD